jgi:uncharacterized membrane protein YagU involved in acid resistance
MHRTSPAVIYRAVASGLVGRDAAIRGGTPMAALGMLLHFFIATTAAAAYVAASTKLALLRDRPVTSGLAFGVAVYFFMKEIVVPLSAARPIAFSWAGLLGHALLVGLPIALAARHCGR